MIMWFLLSCASDPKPLSDTGACTEYSYINFGRGFMDSNCQGCHASTTPNRYGAPENVHFDTEEAIWEWRDRILIRSTGSSPDMPPAGGIQAGELEALEEWLSCPPY